MEGCKRGIKQECVIINYEDLTDESKVLLNMDGEFNDVRLKRRKKVYILKSKKH